MLLIVCAREESSDYLPLLQQALGKVHHVDVVIGTEQMGEWRSEVQRATHGVVLLQTRSVLRDPVRLLQLFEATLRRYPLVCVNVVGGGYDFAEAQALLKMPKRELSQEQMTTLRTELQADNGHGVGQLSSSLSHALPKTISVSFNPAASDVMVNAAIEDILDKLRREKKLLRSKSISDEKAMEASNRR